ncbi:peptidase [Bacteroidota bacterium]
MKQAVTFLLVLFCTGLFAQTFNYEVDLSNYEDDIFHVTLHTGKLEKADKHYNFVAYAPGAHQELNFGRFVKTFQVFDSKGDTIPTTKTGTNSWEISNPERVEKIVYDIEDSFDSDAEGSKIYPMSGTGIEPEYVVINAFGIFGYFDNHKSKPVKIKIIFDEDWQVGTALEKNEDGIFIADSYYHLSDSPIFLGELSTASTKVGDIEVEVFVYSKNSEITADTILYLANDVLDAAKEFLTFSPVNRYSFLMYFADMEAMQRNKFTGGGALEHSYSSTYALIDDPSFLAEIDNIMAHEFMHILTPLNLRSQILANFDYDVPCTADYHLWLYEGVTEWTSDIMLLRDGTITIDEYMNEVSTKIRLAERFDPEYSLLRLSTEWNTQEGSLQFANIYELGALTATLLDIKLLELSGGTKGLREVFLELIDKYGKEKPFENEIFFNEFVSLTYPEIGQFIDNYIKDNEPLPCAEYFDKLGIEYIEKKPSENKTPMFGLQLGSLDGEHLSIAGFANDHQNFGLEIGDIILKVLDEDVDLANSQEVLDKRKDMKPGDKYEIVVKRGDEELTFTGTLLERMDYHAFNIKKDCSDEQKKFRELWSRNLEL